MKRSEINQKLLFTSKMIVDPLLDAGFLVVPSQKSKPKAGWLTTADRESLTIDGCRALWKGVKKQISRGAR